MSGDGDGFTPRFLAVLGAEQRRAVLDSVGASLSRGSTLGEIVDAAATLGWSEGVGQLRLIDLADALLRKTPARTQPEPRPQDVDEPEDDEPEDDEAPEAARPAAKPAKPAAAKKSTRKATSKPAEAKPAKKGKGNKSAVPSRDAFDERMSLEEAVAAFVPLVESLGEASMQDLEEATGLGRRKLRFHVGQLVKHGHLTRHGMGRGTFYTV